MEHLTKLIDQYGFGGVSFLALGYVGYRFLNWLDAMTVMGTKFMTNHMDHLQDGMETLVKNSTTANEILDGHSKSLDAQSQMLGILVDRTDRK